MEKIIIAVGSKRGPKLGAVTDALEDIGPLLPGEGEFEVVDATGSRYFLFRPLVAVFGEVPGR